MSSSADLVCVLPNAEDICPPIYYLERESVSSRFKAHLDCMIPISYPTVRYTALPAPRPKPMILPWQNKEKMHGQTLQCRDHHPINISWHNELFGFF